MCIVFQSDLDKMLDVIADYVKKNGTENLKDYLADMEAQNKITYCGCEGLFEVKVEENDILVYIEIMGRVYKFVINNKPFVSGASHSEAIGDTYDDFLGID